MFGSSEVLIAAKKWLGLPGVYKDMDCQTVSYHHVLCLKHEIIFAEGAPAETLLPGSEAIKNLRDEKQDVLKTIACYSQVPARKLIGRKCDVTQLLPRHQKNSKPMLMLVGG